MDGENYKGLTRDEKEQAIRDAWAQYRAQTPSLRNPSWLEYLEADNRLWRRYLATERTVLAAPERRDA